MLVNSLLEINAEIYNMKNYNIVLCILCFFICSNGFSQSRDTLIQLYNSQTIYHYGNKYIKGNQKLSYQDLRLEFTAPETREMYKKSKRRLIISRAFNVASLAVIITSVFTKTNVAGSLEFAAGTGILGLAGIYYQTQSSKFVERALWEKNKEVLGERFSH